MDDHYIRFLAGCCAAGIGVIHLGPLGRLFNPDTNREVDVLGDRDLDGSFNRSASIGIGLLGLWIGIRLMQTVRVPEWWSLFAEMGWAYLIAIPIGAAFFLRGSWRVKWVFALGVIGCVAMYFATIGTPHG